jgi:NADH-quinone oxidoreductase subunit L
MLVLAILSIAFWFSINPFSAHGSWFFNLIPMADEQTIGWLAPASIALVGIGGWVGFRMNEPNHRDSYVRLSVEYGFLDTIYKYFIINPVLKLAALLNRTDQRAVDGAVDGAGVSTVVLAHLTNGLDRYGVDGVVNGAVWLAGRLGGLTRSIQNGRVQSYITAAVVGLLIVLWWLL